MLHFWHSKNLPKPEGRCSAVYIVADANYDSGRLFYFIVFPNISMMIPTVLVLLWDCIAIDKVLIFKLL